MLNRHLASPCRHRLALLLPLLLANNVRFRMYVESDGKFFLKRTPWRFTFTKNAAGGVTGLEADLEGTRRIATKIK